MVDLTKATIPHPIHNDPQTRAWFAVPVRFGSAGMRQDAILRGLRRNDLHALAHAIRTN